MRDSLPYRHVVGFLAIVGLAGVALIQLHDPRLSVAGMLLAVAGATAWLLHGLGRDLSAAVERLAGYAREVSRGGDPPRPVSFRGSWAAFDTRLTDLARGFARELAREREEHRRLDEVLRGMVEGVVVLDAKGNVVLTNPRADRLLDVAPGESNLGRSLIEVVRHPELHALVRLVMEGGTAAGPITREIVMVGDRRQDLQVSATAIAPEVGMPRAYILVCHDITELRRLEETRRDFVANVSHELRTPLAAIRGYSETLRTGALDDRENAARFLGIIERHAERLGRLVDDLLTLSDLELGRAELQKRQVHLDGPIETACEVLRGKAEQAGVTVRQDVAAELPTVSADPDRIVQLLVNLVDNAIKYTPAGGTVTVAARRAAADGLPEGVSSPAAELSVSDTGVGVPPADLPRLTERFYRVDRARSRELGGTGLGLAIVKHIVQAHGGSLRIESEVGRGTTVRVYLPARA